MAEGLNRKKRVRGGHKASATKMITKVEELLAAPDPCNSSQLTQLSMSLKEKLEVIKALDSEILDLIEEDLLADEIDQADAFKEGVYTTLVRIEKYCAGLSPSTPVASARSHTSDPKVKLPKLTIKPFCGDLTAWTTFWDSYKSAVHDNPTISDIDKFNCLRSFLSRGALEAVSGMTLTSANYQEAIEVLKKRFGNKQQIISRHMETLLNAESVTSQYNLKGMRQLYDLIESNVRSLKSLGVSADSYGALLASVLMNKLPSELRLIDSRKIGEADWELDALLKVFEEELQARERTANKYSTDAKRQVKEQSTAAALLSGNSPGPTCCFCQRSHLSSSCDVVTGVEPRLQILRKYGRCYVCLRRGHIARDCRSSIKCSSCKGRHHVCVCRGGATSQEGSAQPAAGTKTTLNAQATPYAPSQSTNALWTYSNRTVLLQTARAEVFNPSDPSTCVHVRIVLDTGSQRSYITDRVKRRLSLVPEGEQCMTIVTFGSTKGESQVHEYVKVGLKFRNGQSMLLTLYSVPMICEPISSQPITRCKEVYPHLFDLDLSDKAGGDSPLQIDVLVGSDHYWDLITGQIRRGPHGPTAIETRLGWVISGPAPSTSSEDSVVGLMTHTLQVSGQASELECLDERLSSFWELESFGIPETDRTVYSEFQDTVQFKSGRYEVTLPWKDPHPPLPSNYQLCLKRLRGLLQRLQQDKDVLQEYDATIRNQIRKGIVEVISDPGELEVEGVHYLPHHAVIRRDKKTTKLRVVYDASAKSNGASLNDCLHAGPKLHQKILDILLRFRLHRVAVTADIEKAFLMISVRERDREFLRFLWLDDASRDKPEIQVCRFTRVMFGVSCSPFLLNATIRHHLEGNTQSHPQLVDQIRNSIYVDDIVSGAESEELAYEMYTDTKALLKSAGFNLRKFVSNSRQLQKIVDKEEALPQPRQEITGKEAQEDESTFAQATLGGDRGLLPGEQGVLGVKWDVTTDHIVFNLDDIAKSARMLEPTKRNIVSLVGKFYDPLGFLAPVVVKFKIFLQTLCEEKLGWDDTLPENLLQE